MGHEWPNTNRSGRKALYRNGWPGSAINGLAAYPDFWDGRGRMTGWTKPEKGIGKWHVIPRPILTRSIARRVMVPALTQIHRATDDRPGGGAWSGQRSLA
jgi:hypothetical protein